MKLRMYSRGQALVEYAILLTVLVLVTAGGVELATAAFNFYQARSAAEGGVEDWTYAVQSTGTYDLSYGGPDLQIVTSPHGVAIGLGDHEDATAFGRPSCDADPSAYDDGLPVDSITKGGDAVYLYNPRPVETTNCVGQDGSDPLKPRQTALVERLPTLNRVLLPLYDRRCANATGVEISCTDTANVVATYLRLPGKLDPASDTVLLAYLNYDVPSTDPNYQELQSMPRTLELRCRRTQTLIDGVLDAARNTWEICDSASAPSDICWNSNTTPAVVSFACDVQVIVRYRHIFYSFLQFPFIYWQNALPQSALDALDLGPSGVGGVMGAEVGLGNVRLFNRTVKWCFQSVTTPPTPGMQGWRKTAEGGC